MWGKKMYTCMCDWVTLLYSRKLTEHCKPAIMEKNHYFKKILLFTVSISYYYLIAVKCVYRTLESYTFLSCGWKVLCLIAFLSFDILSTPPTHILSAITEGTVLSLASFKALSSEMIVPPELSLPFLDLMSFSQ